MRTGAKVAAALGAAALVVGAPVAFVVRGAGAPGRPDSAGLWWERLRRLPQPVLASPERATAVQAGGVPVQRVEVKVKTLEVRKLPVRSPVVSIAELYDLMAVATFDDGVFELEGGKPAQAVKGVEAVNAVAYDGSELLVASDDGAFVVEPGQRARKVASGAFSAAAGTDLSAYVAGKGGLLRRNGGYQSFTRWGPEQGVRLGQPTSVAVCGPGEICVGAVDGLRKFRLTPRSPGPGACAGYDCERTFDTSRVRLVEVEGEETLPEPFVTAVTYDDRAEKPGTWAGTFDGGLVKLGEAPLAPADGLPEGRINPRALAVVEDTAFAGTPAGLLVARGRRVALVPVGGEVSAVAVSPRGGVWIGLPGQVVRVEVEFPSEPKGELVQWWRNP